MDDVLSTLYTIMEAASPAEELRQVDRYITHYHNGPKKFVLPRVHQHLRPLIATYAQRPDLFLDTVTSVRDTVLRREGPTAKYDQLQQFTRSLVIRSAQADRRRRNTAVSAWIKEHHPELTADERAAWARQIEKHWSEERLEVLDAARFNAGGTLPSEERAALMADFWDSVERRIAAGIFPPHPFGGTDGLELHQPHGI